MRPIVLAFLIVSSCVYASPASAGPNRLQAPPCVECRPVYETQSSRSTSLPSTARADPLQRCVLPFQVPPEVGTSDGLINSHEINFRNLVREGRALNSRFNTLNIHERQRLFDIIDELQRFPGALKVLFGDYRQTHRHPQPPPPPPPPAAAAPGPATHRRTLPFEAPPETSTIHDVIDTHENLFWDLVEEARVLNSRLDKLTVDERKRLLDIIEEMKRFPAAIKDLYKDYYSAHPPPPPPPPAAAAPAAQRRTLPWEISAHSYVLADIIDEHKALMATLALEARELNNRYYTLTADERQRLADVIARLRSMPAALRTLREEVGADRAGPAPPNPGGA